MSCSNDLEKIHEISIQNQATFPVETIKDFQIIYSDSSCVRVLINANLMNRYADEKKYIEFKNGLKVQFFDFNGRKESELRSELAIIDDENDILSAEQNVVLLNNKGDILETEKLHWNRQTEKIYTDEFIKIVTESDTIYGVGLVSDQNFSKYTIKNIKGSMAFDTSYE